MAPACNASTWRQRREEKHKFETREASYYDDPTWKDKIKAKTKMTTSDGNSVRNEEPLHAPQGVSTGTGRMESSETRKRTTRGVGHPPGHTPEGLKERLTHTFLLLPYSQQLKS